jgi:hypothetical protein
MKFFLREIAYTNNKPAYIYGKLKAIALLIEMQLGYIK